MSPSGHDLAMMELALKEAERGRGWTSPNPLVGAVIVDEHGAVLSTGYHARVGGDHGEVAALRPLAGRAPGATIYTTLEPCNHVGRTGNCCEALLRAGVRRVVVGARDPNPHVAGGGIERLRQAGLQVEEDVLGDACREQNRGYLHWVVTGRPFVVLKAAVSLDGRLAPERGALWLTGEEARARAHELRAACDAILVGAGTVLADDPRLTVRLPGWEEGGRRQPLRVVLDGALRTAPAARVYDGRALLLTSEAAAAARPELARAFRERGVTVEALPLRRGGAGEDAGKLDVAAALQLLGRRDVLSVLCEGGGAVHGELLAAGLCQEAALFVAPLFLGEGGVPLGRFRPGAGGPPRLDGLRAEPLGRDVLLRGAFSTAPAAAEEGDHVHRPR